MNSTVRCCLFKGPADGKVSGGRLRNHDASFAGSAGPAETSFTDPQNSVKGVTMTSKEITEDTLRSKEIIFHPIGVIHTEFTEQENTPIQGIFNNAEGTVELLPEYEEGLRDVESFTHLILLYHFDRATGISLLQRPFLDGEKERGIFAIRHFNRPNPIGISIVRLLGVEGRTLHIGGVDMLDGTPLLDIKPYVYQFDNRDEVSSGWVENQHVEDIADWNCTPKELRGRERTNTGN